MSHPGALPSGKRQSNHSCLHDGSLQLQLSLGERCLLRGDSMEVIYIYDLYTYYFIVFAFVLLGVNRVIHVKT